MTTAAAHPGIPEIGLPQRLYLARDWAGYTQTDLASEMGVSRRTIVNAENGSKEPRRPTLAAWALATGVPMEWLETGNAPTGTGPDGGGECPQSGSNRRPADYKCDVLAFPVRQRGRESYYAGREVAA